MSKWRVGTNTHKFVSGDGGLCATCSNTEWWHDERDRKREEAKEKAKEERIRERSRTFGTITDEQAAKWDAARKEQMLKIPVFEHLMIVVDPEITTVPGQIYTRCVWCGSGRDYGECENQSPENRLQKWTEMVCGRPRTIDDPL